MSEQGTASTKTRAEVRGGGKKPYAQKGTGNARMGSKRTPLRPGGGVSFGPKVWRHSIRFAALNKRSAAIWPKWRTNGTRQSSTKKQPVRPACFQTRAAQGLEHQDEQEGAAAGAGHGPAERGVQHDSRGGSDGANPDQLLPRSAPALSRSSSCILRLAHHPGLAVLSLGSDGLDDSVVHLPIVRSCDSIGQLSAICTMSPL